MQDLIRAPHVNEMPKVEAFRTCHAKDILKTSQAVDSEILLIIENIFHLRGNYASPKIINNNLTALIINQSDEMGKK